MVKSMKKVICVLLLFLILISIKKESTIPTFNSDTSSNIYEIVLKNNISTNNFCTYFSPYNVLFITPKDSMYNNNYNKYVFRYNNCNTNIKYFKNDYIKYLTDNGYRIYSNNLNVSGIMISKVRVNINESDLINLKKNLEISNIYEINEY